MRLLLIPAVEEEEDVEGCCCCHCGDLALCNEAAAADEEEGPECELLLPNPIPFDKNPPPLLPVSL